MLFKRAYVPAPVCSACRSALMGGKNQIRFNAHEHRSSRGPAQLFLPEGMKLLPQIMNENGYSTFNLGKTDYNFILDNKEIFTFNQTQRTPIPWDKIKSSQPFYGQIQTAGGKQNTKNWPADRKTDRDAVTVPADSATTLAWAGIPIPDDWEGHDLFSANFEPRSWVAAAKDRLDHTIDRVRTIRTERYRYTRNYKTDRIFLPPQYRDSQPYTKNLHELYHAGKLSDRHKEIRYILENVLLRNSTMWKMIRPKW